MTSGCSAARAMSHALAASSATALAAVPKPASKAGANRRRDGIAARRTAAHPPVPRAHPRAANA
ncbi:hypothetical protein HR12_36660 [Microbacterium sp. SUBG005]|nr:hypothetical protein HR12_36660 [Microbacterium sp. SUBG005]